MKRFLLIVCFLGGGWLRAQTNAVAPPPAPKPTEINSDTADFDLKIRRATYHGHVVVLDPKVKLTCELLILDLPQGGGRLSHVLAETNVVVDFTDDKGSIYHVTSDKAFYYYGVYDSVTNETVTFTGHARAETAEGVITAEPMIWDKGADHFYGSNVHMVSHQNLNAPGTGTNAPALKLF